MPLYNAFLGMGAISKDKTGLRLGEKDGAEYSAIMAQRRTEKQDGR